MQNILCVPKKSPHYNIHPALVTLGRAIRAARQAQGTSQEALANDAGLDRSYLGGIERGEHNITLVSIMRIADSLGVRASELLAQAKL